MLNRLKSRFFAYLHMLRLWRAKARVRSLQKHCRGNLISIVLKEDIGQILVDVRDKGITEQLLASQIRELEDVRALKQLLSEIKLDLVLDIGSNIGFFALIVGKSNASKIVCCEPIDSNFRLLRMNLILNQLEDRVVAKKVAVGDKVGTVEMFVPAECNFSSLEAPMEPTAGTRRETVDMVTLAELYRELNLCQRDHVLIRCDIEGYELPLVEANYDFLQTLKDAWFVIEFHTHLLGKEKSLRFIDLIYEIGFEVKSVSIHRPHHLTSLSGQLETIAVRNYESALGHPIGVRSISSKQEFTETFLHGDFISTRTIHLFMHKA